TRVRVHRGPLPGARVGLRADDRRARRHRPPDRTDRPCTRPRAAGPSRSPGHRLDGEPAVRPRSPRPARRGRTVNAAQHQPASGVATPSTGTPGASGPQLGSYPNVVACWSAKGGAGTTVIAVALARRIAA